MLIVHDICDVLLGKSAKRPLDDLPGVPKLRQEVVEKIKSAAKFDFGTLHLEQIEPGTFRLPSLTKEEIGFWREGLIVLPYQRVWYEFTLGDTRSGLLIEEEGDLWSIERYDWATHVVFDSCSVLVSRSQSGDDGFQTRLVADDERVLKTVVGSNEVFAMFIQYIPLAIYLTLMLNSKTTEMREERSDRKLNAQRVAMGRTPKPDHRVVTIVPKRFTSAGAGVGIGTGHRLHWRRSHLRHFDHHTPGSRWFPELERDGKRGWWVTVIPRHLVGKAELGEVSHEYRVKGVH